MKKRILCVVIGLGLLVFVPLSEAGAAEQEVMQGQSLGDALATDITCATTVTKPYVLSTFPSDALLQSLFRSVYPALKGFTLTVMGKSQNTATGVYTWHMYYNDSTATLRHCSVELIMTKNTVTKFPYYWFYTLSIPTTTGTTSCSGVLEQKYQ